MVGCGLVKWLSDWIREGFRIQSVFYIDFPDWKPRMTNDSCHISLPLSFITSLILKPSANTRNSIKKTTNKKLDNHTLYFSIWPFSNLQKCLWFGRFLYILFPFIPRRTQLSIFSWLQTNIYFFQFMVESFFCYIQQKLNMQIHYFKVLSGPFG